jgi:hypothetical protein
MNMESIRGATKSFNQDGHCDCIIYDFDSNYDYSRYSARVKSDFNIVKKFFPLLKLTILPTVKPREIVTIGNLIPYEVLKKCNSDNDINRYSIYIMATYPSNFNNEDIYVEDIYREIDWEHVPSEHCHLRRHKGKKILCTHHWLGEINGIPKLERSTAILLSAWKLYIQYKKFQRTKRWDLPSLPHNNIEAIKELKKTGSYYGN